MRTARVPSIFQLSQGLGDTGEIIPWQLATWRHPLRYIAEMERYTNHQVRLR